MHSQKVPFYLHSTVPVLHMNHYISALALLNYKDDKNSTSKKKIDKTRRVIKFIQNKSHIFFNVI